MDDELTKRVKTKWSIAFKIAPIIVLVLLLKVLAHRYGFEVITLNALFTSLIAGTIFLLGFLISGVLSDYKESEKIPGELASSLESLYDESYTILKSKNSDAAKRFIEYQKEFGTVLRDWFYRKERTQKVYDGISAMSDFFVEFEKEGVQAGFIVKMKNEQSALRKLVTRTHTIRDTDFVASAYTIVEVLAFFISVGMILVKIEPFYESVFFTALVTFLISYMLFLIKDLDNPFDYHPNVQSSTNVSLRPLDDFSARLSEPAKPPKSRAKKK